MKFRKIISAWLIAFMLSPYVAQAPYVSDLFSQAYAANTTWNNDGGDHLFSNADNWDTDAVPLNDDAVIFDVTSTDTCLFDANVGFLSLTTTSDYTGKLYLQTTIDTCKTNLTIDAATTIVPATSTILCDGSAACTFTSGGETFATVRVNKSANGITVGDAMSCLNFDVDDGTVAQNGQTITFSGDMTVDCDDAVTLDNTVTGTGASGQFHMGSTVGTATCTSLDLVMNGVTGMSIDDDKVITFKSLTLGTNAVVATTGANNTKTQGGDGVTLLTFGDGSTFTLNDSWIFVPGHDNTTVLSFAGTYTFNGTGSFRVYAVATSLTVTIPAFTWGGSNTQFFLAYADEQTWNIGNLALGTASLGCRAAATSDTVTFNFSDITAANITLGVDQAASVANFDMGSGTIDMSGDLSFVNTGASTLDLGTSTWTIAGDVDLGTNTEILNAPTCSGWTLDGTTAVTLTSAGEILPELTLNKSSNGLTLSDALTCMGIDVDDGTARFYYGISCGGNMDFACNDTVEWRGDVKAWGANKTITLSDSTTPEFTTCTLQVLGDKITVTNNTASTKMAVKKCLVNAGDTLIVGGTSDNVLEADRWVIGASSVIDGSNEVKTIYLSPSVTGDISQDASAIINCDAWITAKAAAVTLPAFHVNLGNLGLEGEYQNTKYTLSGRLKCDSILWFDAYPYNDTVDCDTYACSTSYKWHLTNYDAGCVVYLGSGAHSAPVFSVDPHDGAGTPDGVFLHGETATVHDLEEINFLASGETHYYPTYGTAKFYCASSPVLGSHMHMRGRGADYPHVITNATPWIDFETAYNVTAFNIARFECGADSILLPDTVRMTNQGYVAGDYDGSDGDTTHFMTHTATVRCTLYHDGVSAMEIKNTRLRDCVFPEDTVTCDLDSGCVNWGGNY